MAKFHSLSVSEINRETADCVSIAFNIPENLKSDFDYIQGQYLTLKVTLNGEELRRSYSICTSPVSDDHLKIAAKQIPDGRVSTFLNGTLSVGDTMEVMTPMGNFHKPVEAGQSKNYVLVAGGSGVTPILSILKTVLDVETGSSVTLVYANKNTESIIFKSQIGALKAQHGDRLNVIHVLEQGEANVTGMLTKEVADQLFGGQVSTSADEYFICGPQPMMDSVTETLEAKGVSADKVNVEYFTAVLKDLEAAEEKPASTGGGLVADVRVILDDEEFNIKLAQDGDAVLDAAMDAGADVPFSCKGAVCCTCKAKVTEGKMEMDMNYSLSPEEVEQGFVLTCQAHPTTEKVVVNYDEFY